MEKNFEECMRELEATVKQLEGGDIELDKSLELFERGVKLSKHCQELLDKAEKKVSVLMGDGTTAPFGEMENGN